jgi:hypothetical protein
MAPQRSSTPIKGASSRARSLRGSVPLTISWTRLLPYSIRPPRIGWRSSFLSQQCASCVEGPFTRRPPRPDDQPCHAASDVPSRSRRTWRGERNPCRSPNLCSLSSGNQSRSAWRSSSTIKNVRTHTSGSFSVRMNHSATPLPSGARTSAGLDVMPRNRNPA